MNLQEAICPKCGSPSKSGDICPKCQAGKEPWFKCEPRIEITHCRGCESLKDTAGWHDNLRSRDELEYDAVGSAISLYRDVRNPDLSIKLNQYSLNRTTATVTIKGTLFKEPVEGECTIEIIWINESCDRCSRQHGNYWEGVVQVRAEGRKISLQEMQDAQKIALQIEEEMQIQGSRLSFITKIDEIREGLDIVVGSQALGEQIARTITRRMGGRFSMHPTLIGEKDGHKLFRITYAIRLPIYQKGDILSVKGTYGEILGADTKTYTYLDLKTGLPKTVPESTTARYIGHIRDAEHVSIVYKDGSTIGIMNPETGITEEINDISWKSCEVGESVRIIRDDDRIIIV